MTSAPLSLRFFTQAQQDIRRITAELGDLQRQVASGAKSDSLQGFGSASSRILNAQGLRAAAETRVSVIDQMDARFGVQGEAMNQVSTSASDLALTIRQAVSGNDGRGIGTALELAFTGVVTALNQTWNGQPMFAGERQNGVPIKVASLADLAATTQPSDIFDEAQREQVMDLGNGPPIRVAPKASAIAGGLFGTLKDLYALTQNQSAAMGQPLGDVVEQALLNFAVQFEAHAAGFTNEEGRAGQIQKSLENERARLQVRSDLLTREIGDQADADLAQVSIRLNTLMTQYEASAKTFSDLSQMSLLRYL